MSPLQSLFKMNNETSNDTTKPNEKPKSAKANYILKKIKLKVRQGAISGKLPSTSSVDFSGGRQTPEGDENLMISKSASDTTLSELQTVPENEVKTEFSEGEKKNEESVHAFERARSLEIIKRMPAYGELIADAPTMTVTSFAIVIYLIRRPFAQTFSKIGLKNF